MVGMPGESVRPLFGSFSSVADFFGIYGPRARNHRQREWMFRAFVMAVATSASILGQRAHPPLAGRPPFEFWLRTSGSALPRQKALRSSHQRNGWR